LVIASRSVNQGWQCRSASLVQSSLIVVEERVSESSGPAPGSSPSSHDRVDAPTAAAFAIVYAEPVPDDLRALATALLPPGCELRVVASRDRDDLLHLVREADFLLVSTARVDEELLRAAPRLRLVQHQGVGYDNIDVAACRRAGVRVALTPEGTTIGVAEHTLLLILATLRHLPTADAAVRRGEWPVWSLRSRSFELAGKTVGLVGFGRIGREVARRVRAFAATVIYHDPVRAPAAVETEAGAAYAPFDEILRRADVVSLHAPLTTESRTMIGERELRLMQPHAIVINTARGALVDEPALVRALQEGWIAGAGLDVFAQEPPDPTNPLLALPNVILTPHIAAGTRDGYQTKLRAAFANMARVARGEQPLHEV
jgi:phosphoglycerate dehydrogenase-like enzyme